MKRFKIKTLYARGALIAFALLYAVFATLGSTFSWVTNSEQKVNEFAGEMGLRAVIVEDFARQTQWQPGQTVAKTVSVCNDGLSPGFARISFEEIVAAMKPSSVPEPYEDPDEEGVTPEYCYEAAAGNGWQEAGAVFDNVETCEGANPPEPLPGDVVVMVKASPAGAQRNQYAICQKLGALGPFRRMTAQFHAHSSENVTTLTVGNPRYWGYKNDGDDLEAAWGLVNITSATATPPSAGNIGMLVCDTGEKISIGYANLINDPIAPIGGGALTDPATDEGKWFYEGGFFYYIGRLEPGAFSSLLMTGLTLAPDADVSYSSMRLRFIVNLQALQLNAQALVDDWGLSASGRLYEHLSSFC
jgi:hypothetical protein